MKLQVSSPILINLKKICQYNDDNMVQTLSVYYGIDWNWSGIAINDHRNWNCLRDFVPKSELKLPELELNCKNGIDPDSDAGS